MKRTRPCTLSSALAALLLPCIAGAAGQTSDGMWNHVVNGPGPPPRFGHCTVFDPLTRQLILFGGADSSALVYYNDTWVLSLSGPGAPFWRQIGARGQVPAGRFGHAAIWDPIGRRMIVTGGRTEEPPSLLETWTFSLDDSMWLHLNTPI